MWKWILLFGMGITTALQAEIKILAFSGSTREGSVNTKLLTHVAKMAREQGADFAIINLKDFPLPFYDADYENTHGMPENAKKLRALMKGSQVILIASPQYNKSISAVLKNVLDWLSRGEQGGPSRDAFKHKQFVLLCATPSADGGTHGLIHLRSIIEEIGGKVAMEDISIPHAHTAFNSEGTLNDPQKEATVQKIITSIMKQQPTP
jgi:NAD(P)H-dependent FMN reductase